MKFGGRTEAGTDERGRFRVRWIPETEVKGEAYGTPMWARPQFIHFSKAEVCLRCRSIVIHSNSFTAEIRPELCVSIRRSSRRENWRGEGVTLKFTQSIGA